MSFRRQTPTIQLLFFLVVLFSCRKSEEGPEIQWERTYGGSDYESGSDIQETSDGGYIVVGSTNSFGSGGMRIYIVKTDQNGDTLWTRIYGALGEGGFSVRQTTDGGYVVAGYTSTIVAGHTDAYLLKVDANGDFVWHKAFGGVLEDYAYCVEQTSDGGYIIAGHTMSYGEGNGDVYLIRTDSNGDTVWTSTFGTDAPECGKCVKQTHDGEFVIVGYTKFGSYGWTYDDVYLIRTDANGDTVWTRRHGGSVQDVGECLLQTSDGGFVITGHTADPPGNMIQVLLLKTDANGDSVWAYAYAAGHGVAVQQTSDGGFVVTGWNGSETLGPDVYLLKTDNNGNELWETHYGGDLGDQANSVQQTADEGYIIVGRTDSPNESGTDIYVIKTAPVE